MRTKFCSQFINKRPGKIEFQKSKSTLLCGKLRFVIFTGEIFMVKKNLKIAIDWITMVRYSDYGEQRNRESRTAPILENEKNRPSRTARKCTRPIGAEFTPSKQCTMWARTATSHIVQGLAEGAAPYALT